MLPHFRLVIDEVFDSRTGKMNYAGGKIKAGKGNHFMPQTICLQISPEKANATTRASGTHNNNN